MIRGGENIYPREIEEFLFTHPAVEQAAVVGVPDLKYGEELCAWIKLKAGADCTADEIREYCRKKLAHYKVPRYVKLRRHLPADRDRQDPEVQDPRSHDRRAEPGRAGNGVGSEK